MARRGSSQVTIRPEVKFRISRYGDMATPEQLQPGVLSKCGPSAARVPPPSAPAGSPAFPGRGRILVLAVRLLKSASIVMRPALSPGPYGHHRTITSRVGIGACRAPIRNSSGRPWNHPVAGRGRHTGNRQISFRSGRFLSPPVRCGPRRPAEPLRAMAGSVWLPGPAGSQCAGLPPIDTA